MTTASPTCAQPAIAIPETHADERKPIVNRLKRAAGQLNAVITGLESGTSCTQTVTQLAAVRKALDRVGFLIIMTSMRSCLDESDQGSSPSAAVASSVVGPATADIEHLSLEQLEKLFLMLA